MFFILKAQATNSRTFARNTHKVPEKFSKLPSRQFLRLSAAPREGVHSRHIHCVLVSLSLLVRGAT